jgi:hypothetical protein
MSTYNAVVSATHTARLAVVPTPDQVDKTYNLQVTLTKVNGIKTVGNLLSSAEFRKAIEALVISSSDFLNLPRHCLVSPAELTKLVSETITTGLDVETNMLPCEILGDTDTLNLYCQLNFVYQPLPNSCRHRSLPITDSKILQFAVTFK